MNREELLQLVDLDQEAGWRILQAKHIQLNDIEYSDFNKQELAICLNDYSIFSQCLDHVLNFEENELFMFIYKYFDRDFTYNCLQLEPCFSCYKHSENIERIKKPFAEGIKSKVQEFKFNKIYEISEIQIDVKEEKLQLIKIHLPNNEVIPYQKILKPSIICQSLIIEYPAYEFDRINSNMCLCGGLRRGEMEECPRCMMKQIFITFVANPVFEIDPIENESEIQQINEIISEQEHLKQQNYEKLKELKSQIQQHKFKVYMVQQIKDIYKEFNQAAILSKRYSRKIREFYQKREEQKEKCVFSNCIECSRRVLRQAKNIDENLLRKLYFSDRITHKEKEIVIQQLSPNIEYQISDLDNMELNSQVYQEFCLQAQLYLKGENKITFIKQFLEKSKQQKFDEIIIAIIKTLNSISIDEIYSFLTNIKIENICLKQNLISQLFEIENIEIQESLKELVKYIIQQDEILGLNILLNGLEYSRSITFYKIFDEIKIRSSGELVIEFLVQFIKDNFKQSEPLKITKCLEMIQKCWSTVQNNQLKYYIELDKLYNYLGQNNARIDQIYNDLYYNMEIVDKWEILDYLICYILDPNQKNQQIQRLSSMIHKMLFKKTEFKIKVFPYKNNEQYIDKGEEFLSSSFDTLQQLKDQVAKDLGLTVPFDLVIQERIVNDASLEIEFVYQNFYIPEEAKQNKNLQKVLQMASAQQNIQQQEQQQRENQRKKELLQQKVLMRIGYSIQGIGNHSSLPYIPILVDERRNILEKQIKAKISPMDLQRFFIIINNLLADGKRFQGTIQKLVDIIKFLCRISDKIQSYVINCSGIKVLIKIFLQGDNENEKDKLLDFIDDLLNQTQQTNRRFSENIDPIELQFDDSENMTLLDQVLEYLEKNPNKKGTKVLPHAIPIIVRDQSELVQALIQYFQKNLKFEWNNEKLQCFGSILEYTPIHYQKLREATLKSGIYETAIECFILNQGEKAWSETNANCLKLIFSVALGFEECQRSLNSLDIIHIIFKSSVNHDEEVKELAKISAECIEFINNDNGLYIVEELKTTVRNLINERKKTFEDKFKTKKQDIKKKFQKSVYNKQIENLVEVKGLHCVSCKEGYSQNSNQLGIYVFQVQQVIPEEKAFLSLQIQEVLGVQSVTYFTVIHSSCHKESYEIAIKAQPHDQPRPRDDIIWEQAIKNNGCKCNNYLPIKNGNDYESCLEEYFRRCEKITKQKITSKCWILLNDLKNLILRMASQDDLSIDSGAGRYQHNLKLIPIIMTAILHYDINQYSHIMATTQTSFDFLSIAIVLSLFYPISNWQHYKQIYQKEAKEHLLNAIEIIDIIMVNIFSKVQNTENYQKTLDVFLNKDQENVINQFELLPIHYEKKNE